MTDKTREIKINLPAHLQAGAYANNMVVTHTREEFIMDFSFITSTVGTVSARVVTSPGHIKRIISALEDNVKKYESQFGTIIQAEKTGGTSGYNA
jgi:hypothetical protein